MKKDLKLKCMGIGSLPHRNVDDAINVVKNNMTNIPFWPQLAAVNKNEDMIFQFLEKMPGIRRNPETGSVYFDSESDEFFIELEELFLNYEEIMADPESELLDLYAISEDYSSSFKPFLSLLKDKKPEFAKGQIVGPFTLSTSLNDKDGRCAFYDETLKEVIIKGLTLKALWQIREIKRVSPDTTPIIFMDEPSLSQLGTSAFITINQSEVVEIIKGISNIIKENGALSAIHCCGKCDWDAPIDTGVNIINLDGYFFAQNLSLFAQSVEKFIENDGYIAWGIVPTLDAEALKNSDLDSLINKFEEAISYLENKGLARELLISHSMLTPSCGAGSLNVELAQKAMELTKELSEKLIERYGA